MSNLNRNYKNTVFCMMFKDRKRLLTLYNAMNGTHYTNADDLEVNTLEDSIYMNMKNDVSFVFDLSLNLYEHQSTINPNMPLRNLFYVSKILQNIVKNMNLHSSKLVKIPTPRFVVFYNGTDMYPARKTEYLSAAFEKQIGEPELELAVTVINLNYGNKELLEACQFLKEYMMLVQKVREYALEMDIESAVRRAVDECIEEGILAEFLEENRAEVIEVSILEYDKEKVLRFVREESYNDGLEQGVEQGIKQGEQRLTSLIQKLIETSRADEIERVATDKEYRDKLYQEFNM